MVVVVVLTCTFIGLCLLFKGSISVCTGGLPDPLKVQSNLQELITMLDDSKFTSSLSNAINTSLSCQEVLKAKVRCMYINAPTPKFLEV